jgi:hypothetical protein
VRYCKSSGKVRHESRGAAEAQLRAIQKLKEYEGHTYPCTECLGWHVGRFKNRSHRNKYRS